MGYIVKTGKGKRPYKIINQKSGKVVGTSIKIDKAYKSIKYRTEAEINKDTRS